MRKRPTNKARRAIKDKKKRRDLDIFLNYIIFPSDMGNDLTESDMERILLEDPHVIAIDPPEKWMPLNIDLSLWSKDGREAKKHTLDICLKYSKKVP